MNISRPFFLNFNFSHEHLFQVESHILPKIHEWWKEENFYSTSDGREMINNFGCITRFLINVAKMRNSTVDAIKPMPTNSQIILQLCLSRPAAYSCSFSTLPRAFLHQSCAFSICSQAFSSVRSAHPTSVPPQTMLNVFIGPYH